MVPGHRKFRRIVAPLLVFALLVAACSSGEDEVVASSEPAPSTTASTTTTTEPPTTTTTVETTTTIDPRSIAPLTGVVVASDVDLDRPALVLKIDNHPNARPQTGLDQADIVFDLRAESVTRFTAVFHSRIPDPAGPIRSSRTSDFDLLRGLDNPLYGSSGGNDYVISALRSIETIAVTNQTRSEYFRQGGRPAPHNLYVNGSDLYALAPDEVTRPDPWFTYRAEDEPLADTAVPAAGEVTVAFRGGPTVGFTWDPAVPGWRRTQSGSPHTTVDGLQLAPQNVVIMVTSYVVSPADPVSPELVSTGSGELLVLTDGHVVSGTWERQDATDKPTLLDSAGQPISLVPGQTWVLYPEPGQVDDGLGS